LSHLVGLVAMMREFTAAALAYGDYLAILGYRLNSAGAHARLNRASNASVAIGSGDDSA
jgi:hypothetical protein